MNVGLAWAGGQANVHSSQVTPLLQLDVRLKVLSKVTTHRGTKLGIKGSAVIGLWGHWL